MQHQRLLAPEQPRGINAQPEIAAVPRRFAVVPEAFHLWSGGWWADIIYR